LSYATIHRLGVYTEGSEGEAARGCLAEVIFEKYRPFAGLESGRYFLGAARYRNVVG
jgi:hypothetical protein